MKQGRKLVANIDQREGNLLHLRLIDPTDPNAADDPLACINADLVREGEVYFSSYDRLTYSTGLATVDKSLRYISSYSQIMKKLEAGESGSSVSPAPCILKAFLASEGAKMDRLGIFEYVKLANPILADDRQGLVMLARTESSPHLAEYHIIRSNNSIVTMQQILNQIFHLNSPLL